MKYDVPYSTNASKRLPIAFCLDVSPSMGWTVNSNSSNIEMLNAAVQNFIQDLKDDPKVRAHAEVAFVTFSSKVEMDTNFVSVAQLETPHFTPVEKGGTQMAQAVLHTIEKIEKRRAELEDSETPYFAPFLVLLTDGNPDENDDSALQTKALKAVRSHCDSHIGAREIIVPFVIGVGDRIWNQTLQNYSAGFTDGYFHIRGNAENADIEFNRVFRMIGNSTKKSIHLNGKAVEILTTIRSDINELQAEMRATQGL